MNREARRAARSGQIPDKRSALRYPLSSILGLCGLVLAGCAGGSRTAGDPLYGPTPPPPTPARMAAQATGAATPLPPLPAPNSSTSPAALAAGRLQPLDATHDLRIGKPASDGWRGQGAQAGVLLRQPEAVGETPSRPTVPPAGKVTLTAATRNLSVEQILAQLTTRGVQFYRLETGDNGAYTFHCSIPDRQNPNIQHRYEARGHEPVAAMRAVLEQIEREADRR
jgi:hypothetical protein